MLRLGHKNVSETAALALTPTVRAELKGGELALSEYHLRCLVAIIKWMKVGREQINSSLKHVIIPMMKPGIYLRVGVC